MNFPTFRYLRHITVVHRIPVSLDELIVVGHHDEIVYEWALYRGAECIAHSDKGFGSPESALRDGLNEALA